MVGSHAPYDIPRKGFTLVELLIVLALIGIVAAIAVRSVGDTIRRDRVQKAVAIVSTDLETAFAIAARQRTPLATAAAAFGANLMTLLPATTVLAGTRPPPGWP